jgi:signal transduction histidine kinase
MLGAAARMRSLINDLLAYSQASTRVHPFAPTDLGIIAAEVASDMEIALADSDGQLEIGALPVIDADALQMRQLLQNLVSNALKFRRKDTRPLVRVAAALIDPRRCTLTVSDNGIGFNEEHAERIFRMFERLHGRAQYDGSGIGLAICRQIVERHGGAIAATSRPGEGATFTVTLPIAHRPIEYAQ